MQIMFYFNATSLVLKYHICTSNGILTILSILVNALVYFVLTTIVIVTKKTIKFPLNIFSKISSIHIVSSSIFVLFFLANGIDGDYIEIINNTILLYYFFTLGSKDDATYNSEPS